MKIVQVKISNFRGIAEGVVNLSGHTVLVGENNAGKSTVLEAIDLVLGPERLSRRPVVDEHDFYAGQYLSADNSPKQITVQVIVTDLSEEQQRHFREHLEWWHTSAKTLLLGAPAEATNSPDVVPALRVFFKGGYDIEEDDFVGNTYFATPEPSPGGEHQVFRATDKRKCGFLYLRTLRTGSRALSLERGSLLDIILRLQDTRLKMWEELLCSLRGLPVAQDPKLGVSTLLASVQNSVRQFVPSDWAEDPHMRVTDLTRENLRKSLTVFMGTGATQEDGSAYAAPYQHQGTGTINTLVLALLSIIAELKQSVIFAMEEPETALPPHTQKRIVNSVRAKSAQAIFTSHSPYVLEEFGPSQIEVLRRADGKLTSITASIPPAVKPKAYKAEFRARFCEALLAKYVLIVEGRTEFDAIPAAARRLNETHPQWFKSFEALGVAVIDARTDSQIAPLGTYFRSLGKIVFACFDAQQSSVQKGAILSSVDHPFESPFHGFEALVVNTTAEVALRRYASQVVQDGEWPQHLAALTPLPSTDIASLRHALLQYFAWTKGSGDASELLASCSDPNEMPIYVWQSVQKIFHVIEPPTPPAPPAALPSVLSPVSPQAV